jgi:hypothetical protein
MFYRMSERGPAGQRSSSDLVHIDAVTNLEFLAQVFEDKIADQCGDNGDGEVGNSEDVDQSHCQSLAVTVGGGELAHQQIGIEEKDDKAGFDDRTPEGGEATAICARTLHRDFIVQETESSYDQNRRLTLPGQGN